MKAPWTAIIDGVTNIVDDLVTTDEEKAKLALADKKLDYGLIEGQLRVNEKEAEHPSIFVAGGRPAAIWMAVAALGMSTIPKAVVMTGIWTYQAIVIVSHWNGVGAVPVLPEFPDLGSMELTGLLGTLLGVGAMRSWDKKNKTDTKRTQ